MWGLFFGKHFEEKMLSHGRIHHLTIQGSSGSNVSTERAIFMWQSWSANQLKLYMTLPGWKLTQSTSTLQPSPWEPMEQPEGRQHGTYCRCCNGPCKQFLLLTIGAI